MTDDRISSLDALGFDWSVKERAEKKTFAQRIEELKAYKTKHGHVNVKRSEDKSLYDFCGNMRQARKHPEKSDRVLTDDHIASLDALGFDWSVNLLERAAKRAKRPTEADALSAAANANAP